MEEKIKKLTNFIDNLKDKDFTIYFYVVDTKGNPNGSVQYIYETASELIELGYKCVILHTDNEFVGVSGWLGEEYNKIPHVRVEKNNVNVSTSDFLIIPEIFANVMSETLQAKLPCKRIILCQNLNYITEFTKPGESWGDYAILDVITTTQQQSEDIKELFPYVKTKVVPPSIPEYFRNNETPKELMVSVVTKDNATFNKITKQFYWKYPQYGWVTFVGLGGLERNLFADTLRNSAITVWVDDDTYFGYTPLEAMRSGSLVIGKIPNTIPEWMASTEDETLINNGIWFDKLKDVHRLIAQAVKLWMGDAIPQILIDEMKKTSDKYTKQDKIKQLKTVFGELVGERICELEDVKNKIENNIK